MSDYEDSVSLYKHARVTERSRRPTMSFRLAIGLSLWRSNLQNEGEPVLKLKFEAM
jgi:hypothetical protein